MNTAAAPIASSTVNPEIMDEERYDGRRPLGWLGTRPEIPLSALLFIIVVGGWELAVRWMEITPLLVPRPSAVAVSLWDGIRNNTFTYHFGITLYETVAGFVLGAGLGLVLGAVVAATSIRLLRRFAAADATACREALAVQAPEVAELLAR